MVITNLNTHAASYVTVTELAEYWEVTRQLVYKHIQSGLLPAMRLGPRCVRIRTHDAREFERILSSRALNGAARQVGRRPLAMQLIYSGSAGGAANRRKQEEAAREPRAAVVKNEAEDGTGD